MTAHLGRARYLRIADELRREILRGSLTPGSALPSIAELIERYDTSSTTVRQAIGVLRNEGLVYGQQGKGIFVRADRPRYRRFLGDLYGNRPHSSPLAATIEQAGATPRWTNRSRRTDASTTTAERLRIDPGDPVMETEYTFLADDEPIMLSTSFEPLALTAGTPIEYPDSGDATGVVARFESI